MEIRKLSSRLSLPPAAVHLQETWSTLARLGKSAAEKLHQGYCAGKDTLHKLQLSSHDAVAVTNGKIEKFSSQLSIVLGWLAVRLQGAWGTLARLGTRTMWFIDQIVKKALVALRPFVIGRSGTRARTRLVVQQTMLYGAGSIKRNHQEYMVTLVSESAVKQH